MTNFLLTFEIKSFMSIIFIYILYILICYSVFLSNIITTLLQIRNYKLTSIYMYKYYACCINVFRNSPLTLFNPPILTQSFPHINHFQIPPNLNTSLLLNPIYPNNTHFTQLNLYSIICITHFLSSFIRGSKFLKLFDFLLYNG